LGGGVGPLAPSEAETGWGDLSTRALLEVERPSPHPAARDAHVDPPPQGAGEARAHTRFIDTEIFGPFLMV